MGRRLEFDTTMRNREMKVGATEADGRRVFLQQARCKIKIAWGQKSVMQYYLRHSARGLNLMMKTSRPTRMVSVISATELQRGLSLSLIPSSPPPRDHHALLPPFKLPRCTSPACCCCCVARPGHPQTQMDGSTASVFPYNSSTPYLLDATQLLKKIPFAEDLLIICANHASHLLL